MVSAQPAIYFMSAIGTHDTVLRIVDLELFLEGRLERGQARLGEVRADYQPRGRSASARGVLGGSRGADTASGGDVQVKSRTKARTRILLTQGRPTPPASTSTSSSAGEYSSAWATPESWLASAATRFSSSSTFWNDCRLAGLSSGDALPEVRLTTGRLDMPLALQRKR